MGGYHADPEYYMEMGHSSVVCSATLPINGCEAAGDLHYKSTKVCGSKLMVASSSFVCEWKDFKITFPHASSCPLAPKPSYSRVFR